MPLKSIATVPHSADAEQAVLGSVLRNPELISQVMGRLAPDNFYIGLNRDLFRTMTSMFLASTPIDIVTAIDAAVRTGVFERDDDAKLYMVKLLESAVTPSSIEFYAKIVEEKSLVRRLMEACSEIYELAEGGTEEPGRLLDFAETKIYEIRSEKEVSGLLPIGPTVIEAINNLQELAKNPESANLAGLSTSYARLDRCIYGLNPSDLIIIAGRPAMGKTTFAVNIALNVAKRYTDKKVAIFSYEMSREQLVQRMLSSEAKITSDQLRHGNLSRDEWKNIGEAGAVLNKIELYIDDRTNTTVAEMKAKLRRLNNLGCIVIDYLQLMSTGRRSDNRVAEISEITRNLKILAKEMRVPVIVASQLSRENAKRPDKRPMLSDLRDSGSIEQDADIVIFLHRESYYNPEVEFPNACECIISKNRHGETTTVDLNFEGQFSRFTDIDRIHPAE